MKNHNEPPEAVTAAATECRAAEDTVHNQGAGGQILHIPEEGYDKQSIKVRSLLPCKLYWWQQIDRQYKGWVEERVLYLFPDWPWHIAATSCTPSRLKVMLEGCRAIKGSAGSGEQAVEVVTEWLTAQTGIFPVRPGVGSQAAMEAWHFITCRYEIALYLAIENKRIATEERLSAWQEHHQALVDTSGWLTVFTGGGGRWVDGDFQPTAQLETVFPDWQERCAISLNLLRRLHVGKSRPPCLSPSPTFP